MTCAIVLAAGTGKRMGTQTPKQFLELAGRPVLAWTLDAFEHAASIDTVILVVPRDLIAVCRDRFLSGKVIGVVERAGFASQQVA